jgi:fatty aldehyde-generating acyl-ACP reductase
VDTFAFIIHPIGPKRDLRRKFPLAAKLFSEKQINFRSRFFPPVYSSKIDGIRSAATGKEVQSWFIAGVHF